MKSTTDTRTKLLRASSVLFLCCGLIYLFIGRYSLAAIYFSSFTCMTAAVSLGNKKEDNHD